MAPATFHGREIIGLYDNNSRAFSTLSGIIGKDHTNIVLPICYLMVTDGHLMVPWCPRHRRRTFAILSYGVKTKICGTRFNS